MNDHFSRTSLYHSILTHLIFPGIYGDTLWKEVRVVHYWLVPGQLLSPHMHSKSAEGRRQVTVPSSQSTILHQEPRLTEVGMVVSRVEEMRFWKVDFRR